MSSDGGATLSDAPTSAKGGAQYQVKLDRILTKVISSFSHFQPVISERLRSVLRVKLWRMGRQIYPLNSRRRKVLIDKWKESTWNLILKSTEVRSALLEKQAKLQHDLTQECRRSSELEKKVLLLEEKNEALQEKPSASLQSSGKEPQKRKARKSWDECTLRHKRRKLEEIKNTAIAALDNDNFEVLSLEMRSKNSGSVLVLKTADLEPTAPASGKENSATAINSILLVKDKYSISNAAYHELAMSDQGLPRSCQIEKQIKEINQRWEVTNTPEGTTGVQISLKEKLCERVEHLIQISPCDADFRTRQIIKVKMTGDGTWIGKRLHIVTFGFTVLDEGSVVKSAAGNHSVCLLKESENYESLVLGLRDIREEMTDISSQGITVSGIKFDVHFYLGSDWKFIASVCGLDAANATFSCIWCKCAKTERHSLDSVWSIIDEEKGARTTKSIVDASKLSKRSASRFNVSHEPLFKCIPMHQVIPDILHMFLRIADILINLLILELRRQDGIEKCKELDRSKARHVTVYEDHLNKACKIPFQFYICKNTNTLKWRDLTGPEKYRLFSKVDLPSLFPQVPKIATIQQIWCQFFQ